MSEENASLQNRLKDDKVLAESGIVANARMNRERNVVGNNSYEKDLLFHPLRFLEERLVSQEQVYWLDLCCGTGNALIQAALYFDQKQVGERVQLVGVDLKDFFFPIPRPLPTLQLLPASVADWNPAASYDLITCVHGLHYVGDKLGLLQRVCTWLKPDGLFLGHLDYANLRLADGKTSTLIGKDLKQAGLQYRQHKRLIVCEGHRTFQLPYRYLGADDQAGPNYTGQPAVHSYYDRRTPL